jgi:DNA-binding PadR family transcriptional regulator
MLHICGRIRKYYSITHEGEKALEKAKEQIRELVHEVLEGEFAKEGDDE